MGHYGIHQSLTLFPLKENTHVIRLSKDTLITSAAATKRIMLSGEKPIWNHWKSSKNVHGLARLHSWAPYVLLIVSILCQGSSGSHVWRVTLIIVTTGHAVTGKTWQSGKIGSTKPWLLSGSRLNIMEVLNKECSYPAMWKMCTTHGFKTGFK